MSGESPSYIPPEIAREVNSSPETDTAQEIDAATLQIHTFLERSGFLAILQNEVQFQMALDQLDFPTFQSFMTRLNGIMRHVPIPQRHLDGNQVEISSGQGVAYLPPDNDDKQQLLEETLQQLKTIPANQDKGLLLYLALQAIHPFADGNGRTGRVAYTLFKNVGQDQQRILQQLNGLIEHQGDSGPGRQTFEQEVAAPSQTYGIVNYLLGKQLLGPEFADCHRLRSGIQLGAAEITNPELDSVADQLSKVLGESNGAAFNTRDIVLLKFLQQKQQLTSHLRTTPDGRTVIFDGDDIIANLSLADAQLILHIHRQYKQEFVRLLADIIANPQSHQSNQQPIKNLFYAPPPTSSNPTNP